ncbi:hypothetical protein HCZ80_05180 [Limosilactobacillus fermentum]|uniref:hypothetical protein n=1 Tax=Limosilactobacillus fermentum TaxID=1613 RepID=UPI000A715ACA|nr:hypothetical protein [Limosilactobacillus fermentum]MDQ2152611.1 hypothetical protein [Limosilactobacillus fermentum]
MNNSNTTDLTTGKPITRILSFSMPLVLGTLFQQLYSFVIPSSSVVSSLVML